jgi:tRNA 2-thiouridine synthesizing protein A
MEEEGKKSMKMLDAIGLYCPEPLFRLRTAIDGLEEGEVLEMLADDPAAEEDVKRWAKRTGNEILNFEKDGYKLRFRIRKSSNKPDGPGGKS